MEQAIIVNEHKCQLGQPFDVNISLLSTKRNVTLPTNYLGFQVGNKPATDS